MGSTTKRRVFLAIRISLSAAVAAFILGSVVFGLRQQSTELPEDEIDCGYRREMLRNQLVSITQRPLAGLSKEPAVIQRFSTLLRETREVCDAREGDPELLNDLESIEQIFEDYRRRASS